MREGAWINYERSPTLIFEVPDHELWIREPKNADKAGVPANIQKNFGKFRVREDRETFLVYIMQHSPLIRMRGHGADITFEYFSRRNKDPMEAVHAAAHEFGGQLSTLNIYNLATNEVTSMSRDDFDEVLDREGYEGIMRVATRKFDRTSKNVIAKILKLAREVASS